MAHTVSLRRGRLGIIEPKPTRRLGPCAKLGAGATKGLMTQPRPHPPAARARPFPWSSLDATSRESVEALRAVVRWARGHLDVRRLPAVLSDLVGAEVAVLPRGAEIVTGAQGLAGGAGVALAITGEEGIARAV